MQILNMKEKINILKYQDRLINYLRSDLSLKSFIPKIHHTKIVKYLDKKNRELIQEKETLEKEKKYNTFTLRKFLSNKIKKYEFKTYQHFKRQI